MGLLAARLLILVGLLLLPVGSPHARDAPPDWQLTAMASPALRLFTPASGAFFAQTQNGLQRSDDGGSTWYEVSLGPATTILEVDPTNHAILYAADARTLYRSADEATTWRSLLTAPGQEKPTAVAVSPADPNLLYLATSAFGNFHLQRSRDGGANWQVLEAHQFSLCGWSIPILQPHPTDASRVWRSARCVAGREFGASLDQSTDAGDTWLPTFNATPLEPPLLGYPVRLVGGQGAQPTRWYLAVNRDRRLGGSTLYRSDDDGVTWNEMLAYRGGGSPGFPQPGEDPTAPSVNIGGLAYDPSNPDRVAIATRSYPSLFEPPDSGGVTASSDGGLTWAPLGGQDLGPANDLALGIDGLNLYAATEQGVWRLSLACGCVWDP